MKEMSVWKWLGIGVVIALVALFVKHCATVSTAFDELDWDDFEEE